MICRLGRSWLVDRRSKSACLKAPPSLVAELRRRRIGGLGREVHLWLAKNGRT